MGIDNYIRMKEPLGIKDVKYMGSNFFLKNIPGGMMPMDTFMLMHMALKYSDNKGSYVKQMLELGKCQSKEILKSLTGNSKLSRTTENLKLALLPVSISGFGEYALVMVNFPRRKFTIRVKNAFAEQHRKRFSIQKEPIDDFLSGLIAGCMEYFFDEAFKTKETACIAQGKPYCMFEAVKDGKGA